MDACAANLFPRLEGVAAVGEKSGARCSTSNSPALPEKPQRYRIFGKMRDEKSVGAKVGKRKPEPIDPAPASNLNASFCRHVRRLSYSSSTPNSTECLPRQNARRKEEEQFLRR